MRPLPAVLLDLHEDLATGSLILKRGRVSKTVELVNGNPVSTASTPRDETLGHFLVSSGVITEEQHRSAVARAAEQGGKLGEALVAMRSLTVEQLIDQLGKQARHKLVQALRWPQGAWRFDESFDPIEGMQLRMVEVVLGGLKETAVEDLGRLARLDGLSFELTERGRRIRHELKRVFGDRAISLLAAGAPIADIERSFPDRAQGRLAIDAMMMCDAVTAMAITSVGLGSQPVTPLVAPPRTKTRPGSELFDMLFEDMDGDPDGAAPLEFDAEDSGVVSLEDVRQAGSENENATILRQTLIAEHARIKGADHYTVLMVGHKADNDEIETAFRLRASMLDRGTVMMNDPRERAKLGELRQRYDAARAVLQDDRQRQAYDRELAGGELVQVAPAIDTELSFRVAEELMARKQWAQAIGHIKTVIARSPNEADYHAALGWAEWMAGSESAPAGDAARNHLNQALAINPDHAAAHDFKGRIEAKLKQDDAEALFHLERAVDLDPARVEAVAAIEALLVGRGELRRWERVLKRILFRLRGKSSVAEAKAWARLARLYLDHLDDPQGGATAAATARKIAPRDSDVAALISRTDQAAARTSEPIRAGWREALADPHSGAALVASTHASGHADAAFLAASTMVALATADRSMAAMYEQHRVRGTNFPARPLGREHWALLRHKDDGVELGALMELVAPAVQALAPMTLAESDLEAGNKLEDTDVPAAFGRVRAQIAELLGVAAAPVYARVELGTQIHVVAVATPVLVAGDEALTAPERPELVFRLARAMTFLWPGRAVGASRPGRVLRAVVMAIFREASGSAVGLEDPLAPKAEESLLVLDDAARIQARAAALTGCSARRRAEPLAVGARALAHRGPRGHAAVRRRSGRLRRRRRGRRARSRSAGLRAAHVNLRAQLGLSRV